MPATAGANMNLMLRELDEVRKRELAQRDELARRERVTRHLSIYYAKLRSFLRYEARKLELDRMLAGIARLSSEALDVERVSVWLFDDARQRLSCAVLLVDGAEQSTAGATIEASEFPMYFKALLEGECLAVEDPRHDPRTSDLTRFLEVFDIEASIDVPIRNADGIIGVVRHAKVGRKLTWDYAQVDFAASVGANIALELESARRSLAERDAHEAAAKYQHLVETLPVTVYSFDVRTRRFDYLSPNVHALGGWTAERWLREGSFRQWLELVHPDDRSAVLAAFKRRPVETEELVYRVVLDARTIRWVRDTRKVVRDHTGAPMFVQGVLADITSWKESQLYGSELERGLFSLLENVEMLALVVDARGRLSFVNERLVQISGYDRTQLLGRDFFEATAPSESEELSTQYRQALLDGNIPAHLESTLLTAHGTERRVLWTNQPLRNADGSLRGVVCLGLDLTDRLRLKQELLEQTRLESMGRLAAGVAHDFNNLLTVMMGEVDLMCDPASGETLSSARDVLQPALRQAAEMTRALLTYVRMQPTSPTIVDVDALLQEEVRLLRALAGRNVELTVSQAAGGATVLVEPSLLRQALWNLVSNASDATSSHGGQVSIASGVEYVDAVTARKHGAAHSGRYVVLAVRDNGRGMDAGTLSRVFEPFFSTKLNSKGTGLGLATCLGIVRRAGGFITVESEPEKGSTFSVYFPETAAADSEAPGPYEAVKRPSGLRTTYSVLFVQQRCPLRQSAVEWLASAGYRVFTATDTKSAADILSDLHIDVLIADATLNDGLGAVLLRSARAVHGELGTLLVTNTAEEQEGIDAVLTRPFDGEQLVGAVDRFIATRSSYALDSA